MSNQYNTIVYKLGGTSQCKFGYDRLIEKINNKISTTSNKIFIVLSAVSGVTNNLVKFTETKKIEYIDKVIELNNKLLDELNLTYNILEYTYNILKELANKYLISYDMTDIYVKSEIIGFGEILSTNIFYEYLKTKNIDTNNTTSILLDSYNYIMSTKEIYQCNATTEFFCYNLYDLPIMKIYNIFIMQGFIASTPSGKKIILGRGGSDTTGSLVAKHVNALYYEVWTDVDGIYTGDPRVFPYSKCITTIDYELVQELSAMGAKVMHPLSIKPCADSNIPIIVTNTFNDKAKGTKICNTKIISDIFYAIQKNQTIFKIKSLDMWNSYGFITDIFRRFSENRIDVNIVTTSQFSISATTSEPNLYKLLELKDSLLEKYNVEMINNCTIFSIVKHNIRTIIDKLSMDKYSTCDIIHISDNNMTVNIVFKDISINDINNLTID